MTTTLESTRASVAILALYLSKAEARDKICRTIQYGAKFIANGEAGVAKGVESNTSLARKVFRLLKAVNEVHTLLGGTPKSTPLPLAILMKIKSALMGTFLTLDQVVWLGRSNIIKDKPTWEMCGKLAMYCWMCGCATGSVVEAWELSRLGSSMKIKDAELQKVVDETSAGDSQKLREEILAMTLKSHTRTLNFIKSSMDVFVAAGQLQLAPGTITPRVTGAFGVITSLISCYQLFPAPTKVKTA